jgi:hypothetical protein
MGAAESPPWRCSVVRSQHGRRHPSRLVHRVRAVLRGATTRRRHARVELENHVVAMLLQLMVSRLERRI